MIRQALKVAPPVFSIDTEKKEPAGSYNDDIQLRREKKTTLYR
jgi:hypothetical protein